MKVKLRKLGAAESLLAKRWDPCGVPVDLAILLSWVWLK